MNGMPARCAASMARPSESRSPGNRRDQHRRHLVVEGQRQRVLVEAEKIVRPGSRAGRKFVEAGGIDADGKALAPSVPAPPRQASGNGVSGRQPRSMTSAPASASARALRHQRVDREHRRVDDLGKDAHVVPGKVGRLAGAAEKRRKVGDFVRAAHERHAEMLREPLEIAAIAAGQNDAVGAIGRASAGA